MTIRRFERTRPRGVVFCEIEPRKLYALHRSGGAGWPTQESKWPSSGRFKRQEDVTKYVETWVAELDERWHEVAVKPVQAAQPAKVAAMELPGGKRLSPKWREALGPDATLDAKQLDLYEARLPRSLEALAHFEKLERLNLGGTGVRDLRPLSKLTKLRELVLGNNPDLVSLAPLAGLTQLASLEIDYTGVKDVNALAKLKKLRYLLVEGLDEGALEASLAKLPKTCRVSWAS